MFWKLIEARSHKGKIFFNWISKWVEVWESVIEDRPLDELKNVEYAQGKVIHYFSKDNLLDCQAKIEQAKRWQVDNIDINHRTTELQT